MKGKSISILGIFAAVLGMIFILCYKNINVQGITVTCGILFVIVGLVNLVFFGRKSGEKLSSEPVFTMISNAAAIVLGVSMLVFLEGFRPMIAFMLGLLVAVCALWQFFVLAIGARPYQLPAWLYVFPLLLVAGAVFIFFQKIDQGDEKIILGTGISFAVLGVGSIIEGSVLGVARRNFEKAHEMHQAEEGARDTAQYRPETETRDIIVDPTPQISHRKTETTDDLDDEIEG